jgi:hypothetical protein
MLCTLSSCHAQCSSLCVAMRSPSAHRHQSSCLPPTTHSSSVQQHRCVLDSRTDHHRGHAIAVVGSCAVIVVRLCDRHTGSEQGIGAEWCCRCKCVCVRACACLCVRLGTCGLRSSVTMCWPSSNSHLDATVTAHQAHPHRLTLRPCGASEEDPGGGGACQCGHETQWATCVTVNQSYCTTSMFVVKHISFWQGPLRLCHVSYSNRVPSPTVLLDLDCANADTGVRQRSQHGWTHVV